MSELEQLLELQATDTAIDQRRSARQRLPERERHAAIAQRLAGLRAERTEAEARAAEVEERLMRAESEGDEVVAQRARLEGKLKTVIAPREAEALQKEMATLSAQRSDLDDLGLELLDELGSVQARIAELADGEAVAAAELEVAAADLAAAEAAIDAELAELEARRAQDAGAVAPTRLAEYEHLRATHGGVGISRLDGNRCGGCHLDLSRSDLEQLRAVPEGEAGECPNCGRLLVG